MSSWHPGYKYISAKVCLTSSSALLFRSKSPLRNASKDRDAQAAPATGVPTFDDDEDDEDEAMEEARSIDEQEAARIAALEYGEDGQPMGARGDRSPSPPTADSIAAISLPNTAQHFTPSHLARLPLFLRVHPQEFEHESYRTERHAALEQEAKDGDNDEKLKDVERRLRCENTIRWKTNPATGKRQSNARFVKWSDGSWTLQVGKEQFDINGLDSRYTPGGSTATPAAGGEQSAEASGSQSQPQAQRRPATQPLTYLASPTWPDAIFQTLSPLHSNISIQPTSLQSATHRLISQNLSSLRSRSAAAKVTMSELVAGEKAPEELKRERERKLLDEERKKRLRRRKEQGGDIEAEEEAELMGLLKGRRKTLVDSLKKSGGGGGKRRSGRDYDDDEESEDDGIGGVTTRRGGGYMEDDADDFIVNDESDGDGDDDASAGRSKKKSSAGPRRAASASDDGMDIDEELDDMEKAEMEIEKQEAARARAKRDNGGASGGATNPVTSTDGSVARKKKGAIVESDDDDDNDDDE